MEGRFSVKGDCMTYSWEDGIPAWLLRRMAKLYCYIWEEPPWNENFWKPENVIKQVFQELLKQDAKLLLSVYRRGLYYCKYEDSICRSMTPSQKDLTTIAGFTWGYAVDRRNLRKISGGKLLDGIFSKGEFVYYIDELGVAQPYRRSGIGKDLSESLIREARKLKYKKVILRTDQKAQAAVSLYGKLGFKDLSIKDEKYSERTYWMKEL